MEYKKNSTLPDSESTFVCKDSANREHIVFKISAEDFANLAAEGFEKDLDFYASYHINLYIKSGAEPVIVEQAGKYAQYPSVAVFLDVLKRLRSVPSARSVLFEQNPYGRQFPTAVEELVASMLADFGIHAADKSDVALLSDVDVVINQRRNTAFVATLLLHFLALVGKLVNKGSGSSWEMHLVDTGST